MPTVDDVPMTTTGYSEGDIVKAGFTTCRVVGLARRYGIEGALVQEVTKTGREGGAPHWTPLSTIRPAD